MPTEYPSVCSPDEIRGMVSLVFHSVAAGLQDDNRLQRQRRAPIPAWGSAPGAKEGPSHQSRTSGKSPHPSSPVRCHESRRWRWDTLGRRVPGAIPQAGIKRAFGPTRRTDRHKCVAWMEQRGIQERRG